MPKIDLENTRAGYASIVLTVDGKEVNVSKSIGYGDGITRGKIDGNARMSLGYSDGSYMADDGTMELYLAEYDEMVDAFGGQIYTKSFTVSVAYVVGGKTRTDTLIGCRFKKREGSNAAGSDALTRTLTFDVLYVKVNGKNPLPDAQMPKGAK